MVKPRENRVPIMMSDQELTSLDDWRFGNRVATRSDAVRRLVQVGLFSTEALPVLANDIHRILQIFEGSGETIAGKMQSASSEEDWKKLALASVHVMGLMIDEATRASASVWGLAERIGSIVENTDVAAAIEAGNRTSETVRVLREATRSDDLKPFQDWAGEQQK